jgi:hypothetical protein
MGLRRARRHRLQRGSAEIALSRSPRLTAESSPDPGPRRGDRRAVRTMQPGDLGAARHVPQPDRVVL